MSTPVQFFGRFAPSPTGVLHLGNLRTALASWLSAKAAGGRWVIRMEDVDGPRCSREAGEIQLGDLAALGLFSDGPVLWQSERTEAYRAALDSFGTRGLLYRCRCSRKELATVASAPHGEEGLRPYPGTCRGQAWGGTLGPRGGEAPRVVPFEGFSALRLHLPGGAVTWEDRLLGCQSDDPAALTGDPILFRKDGCFAYHLAVVVDDGDQGVREVVRGADLRGVTATQIRLQEALGLPRPTYAHLGLVTTPDGGRLDKRGGAMGLLSLVQRGIEVEEVLGWLGWSLGCLEAPAPCVARDLVPSFRWDRVPAGPIPVPPGWC